MVPYKYVNCSVDKTLKLLTGTDRNTYYVIKLLMMLFFTSWLKPWKTDPSKEICTYVT